MSGNIIRDGIYFCAALPDALLDLAPVGIAAASCAASGVWVLKATAAKTAGIALTAFGGLLGALFLYFTIQAAGYLAFLLQERDAEVLKEGVSP